MTVSNKFRHIKSLNRLFFLIIHELDLTLMLLDRASIQLQLRPEFVHLHLVVVSRWLHALDLLLQLAGSLFLLVDHLLLHSYHVLLLLFQLVFIDEDIWRIWLLISMGGKFWWSVLIVLFWWISGLDSKLSLLLDGRLSQLLMFLWFCFGGSLTIAVFFRVRSLDSQ